MPYIWQFVGAMTVAQAFITFISQSVTLIPKYFMK
jgi:hypothetical protein